MQAATASRKPFTCSAEPSATNSTSPLDKLRTKPAIGNWAARLWAVYRKPTPCTRPLYRTLRHVIIAVAYPHCVYVSCPLQVHFARITPVGSHYNGQLFLWLQSGPQSGRDNGCCLYAEDARPKSYHPPTGRTGLSNFLIRKSSFRTQGHGHVFSWCNNSRLSAWMSQDASRR